MSSNINLASRVEQGVGNNFDLIRLFAASSVIFSHSFGLIANGGSAAADPLFQLSHGQMTFGELGVFIFFVASGFLITPSIIRSKGLASYFSKRLLRIMPGLIFSVSMSIFVIGPVVSELPLARYFGSFETYRYLVNISMFFSQPGLPGVFANAPLPGMVNGSLWTLKFEFFCYVLLAFLSVSKLLSQKYCLPLLAIVFMASLVYSGPGYGYVFYCSYFLAGSALYLLKELVRLNGILAFTALLALIICCLFGFLKAGFVIFGSYIIIYLAYKNDLGDRMRQRFGDYSYGLYLFGFPIQQTVATLLGEEKTWWKEFLISYPVAFCFAVISWKLIEHPALRVRSNLNSPKHVGSAVL